jgi:hypothetical protein
MPPRNALLSMAALGAALMAGPVAAGSPMTGLAPGQAHPITLGEARGIAYYTVEADGAYRVVTTITAGEDAHPVRSIATLRPGQATTVSVPGPDGAAASDVTFQRSGDRLTVSLPVLQEASLR